MKGIVFAGTDASHSSLASKAMPSEYEAIRHEDLVYALSEIDTYIDVSEADPLKIYELATGREVKSGS